MSSPIRDPQASQPISLTLSLSLSLGSPRLQQAGSMKAAPCIALLSLPRSSPRLPGFFPFQGKFPPTFQRIGKKRKAKKARDDPRRSARRWTEANRVEWRKRWRTVGGARRTVAFRGRIRTGDAGEGRGGADRAGDR